MNLPVGRIPFDCRISGWARRLVHWAPLAGVVLARSTIGFPTAATDGAAELVHVDGAGVMRWNSDDREVALFGANYSLASASDYRAAGYLGADRKKLVEQDLAHFARMGWDGMRLCFWGDWENSDRQGNLIANDHLDILDYAIAQAKRRGIFVLFTPITTYSAIWPDGKDSDEIRGFSKQYERDELGTNPQAIAAECNYLRQILAHVNPYTGVALKDEPAILFVEMINEPVPRPEDFAGSVAYIDALVAAVRSTGCRKILFHNVSQDIRTAPAIKASQAQGVSFAWYPTGLNFGHALTENHLRAVDDYPPMLRPDLLGMPKVVYEFDSADMNSGYMYPAMVREFRGVGAQFIAMFSYDMLATAPYNLGWQTHFLNLVYSPNKAASAIIAAEATRVLPRGRHYGDYPDNRRFGPFRVSYEEDLSEMATDEQFLYANDTATAPPRPEALRRIVGFGSSPIVQYEGCGLYFLDRLADRHWRLEVYPDAVLVQDPFAQHLNFRTVSSRLVVREWPMTVRLPDLGGSFRIAPLNAGNAWATVAKDGRFKIRPGVYLLSSGEPLERSRLPTQIGGVKMDEFVCPSPPDLPPQVVLKPRAVFPLDHPVTIAAEVVASAAPDEVVLHLRQGRSGPFQPYPMNPIKGYVYQTTFQPEENRPGPAEYYVSVKSRGAESRFPEAGGEGAGEAVWRTELVAPQAPVMLFDGGKDGGRFAFTRIADTGRRGIFKILPAAGDDPAAFRLFNPIGRNSSLDDYTASLSIKDRIVERRPEVAGVRLLHVRARASTDGQCVDLTLVEADGTSWSHRVTLGKEWKDFTVPLDQLRIALGVKLPLGFPDRWNYWMAPAKGRGGPGDRLHPESAEQMQISFRPPVASVSADPDPSADFAFLTMTFE